MLPLELIRENPDLVKANAAAKGMDAPVDEVLELDARRRRLLVEVEELRAERNRTSKELARSRDPEQIKAMREVGDRIKKLETELGEVEKRLDDRLLYIPNLADTSVPQGKSEADNVEVAIWGERRKFTFTPRPHYEVAERLGWMDFERAAKLAGSRFAVLFGDGAALERALQQFMIDLQTREHHYVEVLPPYLVRSSAMVGTANLPRFGDEAFHLEREDLWLIPTAEVPVTNLYAGEVLEGARLPIRHVALTPCWRSEAGAAGKDTRGYIRLHQFHKVELVKFCDPATHLDELDSLLADAEVVLRRLELPYRTLLMCTADMGFAQTKKFDLEAWAAGLERYLEVSSCSSFGTFQARRANIRYRPEPGARPQFVATLNGSGLAAVRVVSALIEHYQREDGRVDVPVALRPYLQDREVLG
jgi:seryl-tRNA synthetase